VVARLGGDEFLVIAGELTDPAQAVELAERLVQTCATPFTSVAGSAVVGMSVGVAVHRGDGVEDAAELVRRADIAAALAKRNGRNRVEVFDEDLREQLTEADDLGRRLRSAIAAHQLCLHYQPVVDAGSGALVGLEALVRWQGPDGRFISPGEFVPVAERSDLILELDRWVADRAAQQLASWIDHPVLSGVPVAVNLSARHLATPSFVDDVVTPLERHGVPFGLMSVEVTEGVMVGDLARARERLGAIRDAGVRVAVDDFGTGFTSIANLRQLPVDVLKIDRSIVASTTDGDRSILALLALVGATLGQVVVAEGVETDEDIARARESGCHRLQGWAIAKALPPEELEAVVASWPDRCSPRLALVSPGGSALT
jgi:EAL domain-containing protein (putative c-di-GMP-specific phosphodiesterase class I)